MAAPSYITDLFTVYDMDGTTAGVELTNYTQGGTVTEEEADYFIQGQFCYSAPNNRKTGLQSIAVPVTTFTMAAGECMFMWQVELAGNAMESFANGGLRVALCTDASNYEVWYTGGNAFGRNPYGGWQNVAVDWRVTPDDSLGSLTTYDMVASCINMVASIDKGNPHGLDCVRKGRGEMAMLDGETANYATFVGLAAYNDINTGGNYNRFGLFQAQGTGYLWKGLLSFGTGSTAVDFRDANRNITIDDCPKTYTSFNRIEINVASSNIEWTSINIASINPTSISIGQFIMIDNATVLLDTCIFTDMDTFQFQSNGTSLNTTFRRCAQVTQGGATFTNCLVEESTAPIAMAVDDIIAVTYVDFTSTGTGYAIEGFSSAGDYDMVGITFTNYAGGVSGTTGNEAVHVLATSGVVNLNISAGGTGDFSYHSEGATVNLISGAVTVGVTVKNAVGQLVNGVRVLLLAATGGTLPAYYTGATIVNSGDEATVTHTSHGMATNDKIEVTYADVQANNGVFSITKVDTDTYTYTMLSSPGSSPTVSTITYAVISDITDSSGYLFVTRVFTNDQPVFGRARRTSTSPLYKTGNVIDTIDKDSGLQATVLLVLDE